MHICSTLDKMDAMTLFKFLLCLSSTFLITGTATTNTISQSADSVDFVQGQNATLFWSVTISGSTWAAVTISRNQQKSDSGLVDIISVRRNPQQKTIYLQGRDVDIEIQGNLAVFNVTFTLGNLTTTDQMYYRTQVVSESFKSLTKYLFIQVLDAAVISIQSADSIDVVEGQTTRLLWYVTISGSSWSSITISRNQQKSDFGLIKIIRIKQEVKAIFLPDMSVDMDVQGTPNVFNVTFILKNVSTTDQMYYRVLVIADSDDTSTKYTLMRVLAVPGRPVLRIQPNQLSYCRNFSIQIILNCSASLGNPTSTNLTFFQNNTEFNRINGSHSNSYAQGVITRKLNQLGAYSFTCQAANTIGSGPKSNIVTTTNKDPPTISNCSNTTVMEGDKLVWTCDANGSEPLTTFWYRENNNTVIQSGRRLTIGTVSRADAGMYRFTASNGEACPAANKTVYLDVHYPPNCTDSTFEVTSGQCLSIQTSDNPLHALNCFPKGNIVTSSSGNSYTMCGVKNTTTSICTISNDFGSCSIIIKVHQRVPEYAYKGFFKITDQNFNDNLKYKNSVEYKTLESRITNMLKTVYKSYRYTSTNVIGFWPGSVIVVFQLKLVAKINDPLLPIVEASRKNGGLIAGFQIDTNNIQPGEYTTPPTMTITTSTTSSPQATFTSHGQSVSTTPCTDCSQVPAIVLGVMFSISLVFNLLFIGYFVWKKRTGNKENRNNSSSYKETMYMNNIAFQDQRANNELQNIEPAINQDQQQPIPPVYQSIQVHTDTYSSLSPNTKLPPKPAVLTNSGDYEDLRGTSHQYQSLDGFSRV